MAKKQLRLKKDIVKKHAGYIPGGLESLMSDVKTDDGIMVRMNFEVNEELRNAFKSKVAQQGKKVKDVFGAFMKEYIDKKRG